MIIVSQDLEIVSQDLFWFITGLMLYKILPHY